VTDETVDRDDAPERDDGALDRLLEKLHREHDFDFREYKRPSLARRIRSRMQQVRVETFEEYIDYLDRHPQEHAALFNTILINITGFFRDPEAWQVLAHEVLPRLVTEAAASQSLRIWCPGCSSGGEAYSVAILLAEALGEQTRAFTVKIYGTDVDEEALATARQAIYRVEDVKDVPADLLGRYFTREGQAYRLRRDLRRWVIFGRHNLAQGPPLSHIDLLVCRNVLIYFTTDLQEKILARFHYAIREGGFLFLGRSESLLARSRGFTPVNLKWRIFQRTAAPVPSLAFLTTRTVPESPLPRGVPGRGDLGALDAARLRRVLDALPTAVMVVSAADDVLVWNAAAEALFEIPAEAAVGRKFRDLDVSYRIEGLRARIEEVKANHVPARLDEVAFTRRSGERVHASILIAPIGDGAPSVLVVASDATEQARLKEQMTRVAEQYATAIEELQSTNEELETTNEELQSTNEELETTNEELQSTNEELEATVEELQAANAELAALNAELERRTAELRRAETYQRMVLSSLDQAVVVLDPAGVVTTWNDAAERLWGVPVDAALGRPLAGLPAGEFARRLSEALPRVLGSGRPEVLHDVAVRGPAAAGARVAVRLAPLRGPGGEPAGLVAVALPPDLVA